MKQLFAMCGIAAALICGAGTVSAQDNNGGGGGGGGFGGGGGGRRGNFNPEQMRQDYVTFVRDYLGFTNDTEWGAVQPLVQKVLDSERDQGSTMGNGFRMFMEKRMADRNGGDPNGGGQNGGQRRFRGGGMFGGQPSPEYTALQDAINNNAPAGQIKDLLSRYTASQKAKQDKLKAAQDNLRAVLEPGTQEARATLLGLLD
ncbi:MAG TPA: hypothetical protein VGJ73_04845 [Verrucomicrobiae bacterium]